MTHLVSDLVRLGWAARPGFVAERQQPAAALPETEESGNHTTWAEVQEAMAISEAARLEDVAAAQAAVVEGVGTVCPRCGKPPPTDLIWAKEVLGQTSLSPVAACWSCLICCSSAFAMIFRFEDTLKSKIWFCTAAAPAGY